MLINRLERVQERLDVRRTEVIIPAEIDEAWLRWFNENYASCVGKQEFTGTVLVENWLVVTERGPIIFQERMGKRPELRNTIGRYREISGVINIAGPIPIENLGYYGDPISGSKIQLLSLFIASIHLPDGHKEELADGGLVLLRLDKLKKITVSLGERLY